MIYDIMMVKCIGGFQHGTCAIFDHVQDNLLMLFIHDGVQIFSRVHGYDLADPKDPGESCRAVRWPLQHRCLRRRRRERVTVRPVQPEKLRQPLQRIAVKIWRLFKRLQCLAVSVGLHQDQSVCKHERSVSGLFAGFPLQISIVKQHLAHRMIQFSWDQHLMNFGFLKLDASRRRRRRVDAVDWTVSIEAGSLGSRCQQNVLV